MSDNKSVPIKVKTKSDPEALLNDLSTSLKSYQSTVKNWTTNSSAATEKFSNPPALTVFDSNRPARLGLGAKPQKNNVAALESVSKTLELKKQIVSSNKVIKTTASKNNNFCSKKIIKKSNNYLNEEDEERGRASMIKSRK